MAKYVDDFGVGVFTGVNEVLDKNETGALLTYGGIHQIIVPVKVVEGVVCPSDNAASGTGFGRGAAKIPAGALIKACYLAIREPATSGDITVGLYKADGTAIKLGADDAVLLEDDADSAGLIVGNGNFLLEKTSVDAFIKVTPTANATAYADADMDIIVEYV